MKMNKEHEGYEGYKSDIPFFPPLSFSERYADELKQLDASLQPHPFLQDWEWINDWDEYALKYDDEVYTSSNMYILEM
jgi:hypothetical protein